MSWSYSGDPSLSEADAVRFEIPDTDEASPLVSDEEIAYALEEESGALGAAARCCESLSRKYAMQADVGTGDVKLTYSKAAENLAARAKELRTRAIASNGVPFAGGISAADKKARAEDEDRTQGSFQRGQFDNTLSGL
jgi:hypothetical protein